jgi:hypothetical protein
MEVNHRGTKVSKMLGDGDRSPRRSRGGSEAKPGDVTATTFPRALTSAGFVSDPVGRFAAGRPIALLRALWVDFVSL